MKLQQQALSLSFILVILTGSLLAVPSVRAQGASSITTTLKGTLPILGPYTFDICSLASLGLISCSLTFLAAEEYTQDVTLQVQDTPNELQMNSMESTAVTLSTAQPVSVLDLNFTYGGTVYTFPIPLPTVPVPGNIPVEISLTGIVAKLLTGSFIGGIINSIASLNLDLNFTSEIQGRLSSEGFQLAQQQLTWDTASADTFSSTFAAYTQDASVSVSELDAVLGLGAALVLKLPLLSPINLFNPIYEPLLQIGSSTDKLSLGHWYHLAVESLYSQTTGSGWYLSGSTAIFNIAQTTIPAQNGNYQFNGWLGTGPGSYSGDGQAESIIAAGPANETANWSYIANVPQIPILGSTTWTLGLASLLGLIAVIVVTVVLAARRKRI